MPLTLPTTRGFTTSRFGLESNTQSFESPLTKATQRVRLSGSRWLWNFSLPPMHRSKAAVWQAFLLQLEGRANTFHGFDPDAIDPRGVGGGTPLVNGASQTGSSLNIDGLPASVANWLLPGDYFAVNNELKMVTAPVTANGSGQAAVQFKPFLRNSPADNAPLTITKATCEMALMDDQQTVWECNEVGVYLPKTIAAIEVFS